MNFSESIKSMSKPLIIGLSASLRSARSQAGALTVRDEVAALEDREALDIYLEEHASIHLEQFKSAGRTDGRPFDELYRNLKRDGGHRGYSNSEVALAAALWGAMQNGADIGYIPLSDHFPVDGDPRELDKLKERLRKADGIILSSPVYFGDRSSLSQRLIDMIRSDEAFRSDMEGKLYTGVAIGAKRNGGQETTLIYAMMDMVNAGFLAVGNDSNTTSQYGGTGHAGDVGTMAKDVYGINTSIGAGRRIASVAVQMKTAEAHSLTDKVRMDFWVLQDRDGEAADRLAPFAKMQEDYVEPRFVSLVESVIRPCIACDICPTHIGPDSEYRCIIKRRDDGVAANHESLLWGDVLAPTVFSPNDRRGLETRYQEFMERTRYLRRGDYVFTDHLVAPLVLTEVGANEIMDVRMATSFVRHHTVIMKPIVAVLHEGKILNPEVVREGLAKAAEYGRRLTVGRLASVSPELAASQYQPVGYVLAAAKDREEKAIRKREEAVNNRLEEQHAQACARLA